MSKVSEVNVYEQALVAVLNEAKLLGTDVNKLVKNLTTGMAAFKYHILLTRI